MKKHFFQWILIWSLSIALFFNLRSTIVAEPVSPLPHEPLGLLELKKIKEPSGICYHCGRKTLFVADDSGWVGECKPDGTVIQQKKIRKADFEGITHNPSTGLLYVVIEGMDSILEVDPENLQAMREFAVPRTFQGKTLMKEGGQGLEAITFVPDSNHSFGGTFFIANQSNKLDDQEDISGIFEVELPTSGTTVITHPAQANILRYFKAGVIDISGLYYDAPNDTLYAISDTMNQIMAYTRSGDIRHTWSLPGEDQEGITVDPDGIMYIAQDSGGILKLRVAWDKMK